MSTSIDTTDGGLSPDCLLDVLNHPIRRRVLTYLYGVETADLDELTAELSAADGDRPEDARTRVATLLHHVHLPKLVNAGLVAYDGHENEIRLRRRSRRVETYLSLVNRDTNA